MDERGEEEFARLTTLAASMWPRVAIIQGISATVSHASRSLALGEEQAPDGLEAHRGFALPVVNETSACGAAARPVRTIQRRSFSSSQSSASGKTSSSVAAISAALHHFQPSTSLRSMSVKPRVSGANSPVRMA